MSVFISHSSHNKTQALALGESLGEAGLTSWIDQDDLHAGTLLR